MFNLNYAKGIGNNIKVIREFEIPKSTFYKWKEAYEKEGPDGLIRKKPVARAHPRMIKPEVTEKVLYLRKAYQLGS